MSFRTDFNYYEVLEVNAQANHHDIFQAYQNLKATYSQTNPALYTMFSSEEASELLKMVEEAYEVLSQSEKRNAYDQFLNELELERQGLAPSSSAVTDPDGVPLAVPTPDNDVAVPFLPDPEPNQPVEMQGTNFRDTPETQITHRTSTNGMFSPQYTVDAEFDLEIENTTDFDGPTLQKIRLYRNISLDYISEVSRISRTYLMALEADDYPSLPAPVFVRGFVSQIAKTLGLDDKLVTKSYVDNYKDYLAKNK